MPARVLILLSLFLCVCLPVRGQAEDKPLAPARLRFADAGTDEVPDFQRHVVPLLGRLGCNGRACHGSFQGRGGFRLSLFGYDFAMDHAALTAKAKSETGSRIDRNDPSGSLILRKPLELTDHEGGQRFEQDSWEHHLLQNWIQSGTRGTAPPGNLESLHVEPAALSLSAPKQNRSLRVIAVWSDGSREDVTCLCRFRTNDDSIAVVDPDGNVQSTGRGDTHVVAFYDNGVAAVPVMIPVSDQSGESWPGPAASTEIDRLITRKLKTLGIIPSEICSDAQFLRRASIDITGSLPKPDEIREFLADKSPDKRSKKIDELLDRPAYAAWWANRLCDYTGCNPNQQAELGQELAVQWYMWIYQRVLDNVPYDELVEGIVLSQGREEGQSFADYSESVSSLFRDDEPADFSARSTMPHYWSRRSMKEPKDRALAFAHSFLGIRLQCAQCHKHPWDQWTQRDFQQFTSFFENIQFGVRDEDQDEYRQMAKQVGLNVRGKNGSPIRPDVLAHAQDGRTVPWRELFISSRKQPVTLSLLRSRQVELDMNDDPRRPLMKWMREADNPWFARAFVNRVWAGYFHVGIVNPPDDLNPANPPSHPELLAWLTRGFINSGYDMKWLHRTIANSDACQRAWKPNDTNREDRRNFSRSIPRRLPAEVFYDAVKQATAASYELDKVRNDLTRRATAHLSMRMAGTYAMHVFGKPERAVNCDCERSEDPTLLQAIFINNDPLMHQRITGSGWIREVVEASDSGSEPDLAALVEEVWLRTVNRPVEPHERDHAVQFLKKAPSLREGLIDVLWAMLNTKEFLLY